jgi:hypothetical protein
MTPMTSTTPSTPATTAGLMVTISTAGDPQLGHTRETFFPRGYQVY